MKLFTVHGTVRLERLHHAYVFTSRQSYLLCDKRKVGSTEYHHGNLTQISHRYVKLSPFHFLLLTLHCLLSNQAIQKLVMVLELRFCYNLNKTHFS